MFLSLHSFMLIINLPLKTLLKHYTPLNPPKHCLQALQQSAFSSHLSFELATPLNNLSAVIAFF